MHEHGLVRSLLKQVHSVAREHSHAIVRTVAVEIGPLAGVEPMLVRLAFDELVSESFDHPVQLDVTDVPLQAKCSGCRTEFEVNHFRFHCPLCGSADTVVTRGDEFRLTSVSVDEPA